MYEENPAVSAITPTARLAGGLETRLQRQTRLIREVSARERAKRSEAAAGRTGGTHTLLPWHRSSRPQQ